MKRVFSILLITALLIALTPVMGTVALAEEYATVTSENGYGVRLREGPSKGYGVIRLYSVGTTVVVLQTGAEWSQLKIGDTVGWMQNRYLKFGTVGSTSSAGSNIVGVANATVTSGNGLRVWLRSAPSGTRLQLYSPGTAVTVIERGNTWCHIAINGSVGYMMTEFLAFEKPPAPPSGKIESVSINYPYPVVGDVLEVSEIKPADATVKYSWKVDGIELGTEPTFSVLTRYEGKKISLTVTGIGNCTGSATDTCDDKVQLSRGMKSVKLDKLAPVVGDEIKAILQPSSASVEYYWRVAGVEVSNDPTYTVQESDIGKLIQLKVVGVGGYEGSVACSAEAYVVSDKEIQSVELSKKSPVVGETVSAKVLPAGASVKYTWTVDGEVVSNNATYQVQKLQLGKQLRVTVEGVDPYTGSASDISQRISSQEITGVSISGADEPVVGDVLYARLTPSNATASFIWYYEGEYDPEDPDKNNKGKGASITVGSEMVDKKLMVRAEGSGIYSGIVLSDLTAPVINNKKITGVTLDNTYPVVGDVLTATPYPKPEKEALVPAFQQDQTYVWTIDTEVSPEHGYQYTVKASDVGKQIRVKVIGSNGYVGEAFSVYTNPVKDTTKIAGVSIKNKTTDVSAHTAAPEGGDVLEAIIDPPQAKATYKWTVDNAVKGNASTYTVAAEDAGKKITVTVEGDGVYYTGMATSNAVQVSKLTALNASLSLAKPVAGKPPVYTTSYVHDKVTYTGNVNWLFSVSPRTQAELDRHGHFLPESTYIAAIELKLPNGYTVSNGTFSIPGAANVRVEKGIIYAEFQTGKQQISDYYIVGLPRPVEGEEPVEKIATDQYTAEVKWADSGLNGTVFAAASQYEATITLVGDNEYITGGLPQNVFVVSTADSTTSTANPTADSNDAITIKAIFKSQDPYVTVTADKTDVYLDGYNSRLVQCLAGAENFIGNLSTVRFTWEIIDAVVDGTSINADGQLTIGMYETTDRTIRVRVWGDLNNNNKRDKKEEATIGIQLLSGTDTDTAIRVEFTKAPVQVAKGSEAEFGVKVHNSTKGFRLYVYAPGEEEITSTMKFMVDSDTKETQFVVKAISIEDPSVTASIVVKIDGKESIIPKSLDDVLLLDEMILLDEIVVEDEAAVETTEGEEPAAELPAEEDVAVEEIPAEPVIEITEPVEEAPAAEEEAEEVPAEPVEEEVAVEEVPAEPVIEITEPVEEAPAAEEEAEEVPAEPTIEITIPVEEEPAAEDEIPDEVVIEIKDTVTGEVVEAEEAEEPVAEETEEELTGVVIEIKDTVTGEVIEEQTEEEPAAEKAAEEKKTSKKAETEDEEEAEEELDPELDDLEGDKDVGESTAESLIKIRFVEMVSEIKRGNTAVFSVETEGTEQGVSWSVRRSKNADGKKVSTIDQNGLLTVSSEETAEKLIVVATSVEDGTVRARWIVSVTNPVGKSTKKTSTEAAKEEVLTEEDVIEESVEQPAIEENVEEEIEVEPENEGLTEEQLRKIQEELEALELENAVLENF